MKKVKAKKDKRKSLYVILTGGFFYLIAALILAVLVETGKVKISNNAYWTDLIYFIITLAAFLSFKLKEPNISYMQSIFYLLVIAILSLVISFITASQNTTEIFHNPIVLLLGGLTGTLAAKAISIKAPKRRM